MTILHDLAASYHALPLWWQLLILAGIAAVFALIGAVPVLLWQLRRYREEDARLYPTAAEVAAAKAQQRLARLAAGLDPETGQPGVSRQPFKGADRRRQYQDEATTERQARLRSLQGKH